MRGEQNGFGLFVAAGDSQAAGHEVPRSRLVSAYFGQLGDPQTVLSSWTPGQTLRLDLFDDRGPMSQPGGGWPW